MVNDITREYSVYITDELNSVCGSGVLFYAGGDYLFVFTCAHVVDNLKTVRLLLLKEIDASQDDYKEYYIDVPASQVFYSPLDEVGTDGLGQTTHTEDIAIILAGRPIDFNVLPTHYYIEQAHRSQSVVVQGYPSGIPKGKKPILCLDCLPGCVVAHPSEGVEFTVRMTANFIDQGARVSELEGLSGAPVWDDNNEVNGLLGLFTSAYGQAASLSKTYATKAQRIRTIMKERFNIVIARKIEGSSDDDFIESSFGPISFDGIIQGIGKADYEDWFNEQLSGLRCIIEDLKLQKAIDKGREIVSDSRYSRLRIESKRRLNQILLYCYEIADMDVEFEKLEADMQENGLLKEHDTLRQLTRSFSKRQFQETINTAQRYIDIAHSSDQQPSESDSLLSLAWAFLYLAKAYTDNLPVHDTIGKIIDDKGNFVFSTGDADADALVYQMIGYVYGEHYHEYVMSVRFLKRSYSIGYDGMVLESLGAAYYNLGVYDATDEQGKIPDWTKIEQKNLYKARDCFLTILDKADELFWAGTMRRMGMCVYNTFVFLQDNYRILTLYRDISKYLPNLTDEEWRDIEMKYARVSAQKGEIDINEFKHITVKDGILLNAIAKSCKCFDLVESITANFPPDQIRNMPDLAREIRLTTRYLEDAVRRIDRKDRVPLYVQMINLYGRGMQLFGWDKKYKLEDLYDKLSEYADPCTLESMSNFIFEMDAPLDEAIKRFKSSFDKRKNIITWQELNHLYIRHGMFERADAMYKELLTERKELIQEGPEYAYRAFIDYVTHYRRDLKYAIQCYLDAKKAFRDTDIQGYLELELMFCSSSFNNPERFETERKHFVERGLVPEDSYHRAAFIAYLANLNKEKASEHGNFMLQYPHLLNPRTGTIILSREEIHFLNWVGAAVPGFIPPPDSMEKTAEMARENYERETWHTKIDNQFTNQFRLNKSIAIDAWSLYQIAEAEMLDSLSTMDCVYVSHLSIIRLLEELSRTNNDKIRAMLDYLKACITVKIYSAGFDAQLDVRNVAVYSEPASTVAIAVEQDCIAVYGEPIVDGELVAHFSNRIIRVNQLKELV